MNLFSGLKGQGLRNAPCEPEDHEWEFQDDSFDHEYGCEQVIYWRCKLCDETKQVESGDFEEDDNFNNCFLE